MKFRIVFLLIFSISTSVFAQQQQQGANGKIVRMIVNHNGNNDEIYITTDDSSAACSSVVLRTNNPNVTPTSYNTLFSYLLAAKMSDNVIELYTDLQCRLFRAEIKN